MIDNNTTYSFSYDDGDDNSVSFMKTIDNDTDLATWTKVLFDVANALEVVYGYDIVNSIQVKGRSLKALAMDDFMPAPAFEQPSTGYDDEGEDLDLFPETKAGLSD